MKRMLTILMALAAGTLATMLGLRYARLKATGLASEQAREIIDAIRRCYESTLAALDPNPAEGTTFEQRDARATADAERLRRVVNGLRPVLNPRLMVSVESFVDSITSAQVQIMAFAINRKNRGLPDAAQSEAEQQDRRAFQQTAEPIVEQLTKALS